MSNFSLGKNVKVKELVFVPLAQQNLKRNHR